MFHKYVSEADLTKSHETEGDEKENKNSPPQNFNAENNNIAKIFLACQVNMPAAKDVEQALTGHAYPRIKSLCDAFIWQRAGFI